MIKTEMTMKHIDKLISGTIGVMLLASCADNSRLEYAPDKPGTLSQWEYLNEYDVLKSYIDRAANPAFKFGGGVSLSEFNKTGVVYSLAASNFDEVVAGYEMKHGPVVQADGSMNFGNVEAFVNNAKKAGLGVYGHTLCWHANQNAAYLNSLLAPTVIPGTGGPTWDVVTSADFETDDASNYQHNQNAEVSFTASGQGAGGTGRALKITNATVRTNDWDCQFFVAFSPAMAEVGDMYELSMDVRSDAPATFGTQAHTVPYSYKHWDFFGSISSTAQWSKFTKQITVTNDILGTGAIAFNLGLTATNYYFDNITLKKYNPAGGGGPSLDPSVITASDFENGAAGWTGWGNSSTRELSADGQGYGGKGFAYTLTNPSATNYWSAQAAYDLSPALEPESAYRLNFKVRANASGTIRAELQSTSDYSSDSFGTFAISSEWKEYTLETVVTKNDRNRFVISYGDFAGTVFIDDITLRRVNPDDGGEQIIEKTPEEKREIITAELERWISGMLAVTKDYVKAWDVVNEPMSDWPDPSQLKTGIGKTDMADDEFYWQDYLGKEYARKAIEFARRHGGDDMALFINDYGLESTSQAKCRGLIAYVEYLESDGVTKVDGIGTQMHVTLRHNAEEQAAQEKAIDEMFEALAATGKLVKVSELDMGIQGEDGKNIKTEDATFEQLKKQADFYEFIVKAYFEHVPANQRYGITQWAITDSPAASHWRAGEPIGLWNLNYSRKPAYGGFANGLAGRTVIQP